MRKEFLGVFIVTVLIVSLTLTSVSVSSPSAPVVTVDPQTTEKKKGTTFTINVTVADVNASESLYGWQFKLTFNSTVLNCIDATEGPFMTDTWPYTQLLGPTINNTEGSVLVSCAMKPDPLYGELPEVGATGSGTLATVTFKAVSEGVTSLHFANTKLNTIVGDLPEDIAHTSVDGTVTVTPGHDVAVVSITAPAEAASSSLVPINVTVKNEGSFSEEANVTIRQDGNYIDSKNVTLSVGNSTTVSFNWSASVAAGTYTINATETIPVDDDLSDNNKTTTIRIVEHDVAVTDIDAPSTAKPGATVPIKVTVENQGSNTEEANVTIRRDSNYIDSQNVTITSGTSDDASLSWDTSGLAEGTYTINATATIPVDDDPTDNYQTTTIELKLLHDVNVTSIEAPLRAPAGDMVSINVKVKNEGDFAEEANVTIRYDSTYIDSENLTLAIGENDTAFFTWDTSVGSLPAGYYYIKATATIPEEDDPGDNFQQTLVILTVHDVTANITAQSVAYTEVNMTIKVTVTNEDYYIEKVNVTLRYNAGLIGNQTINLVAGQSLNVSFTWDTSGVSYGNYNLTANATVLASTENPSGIDDNPADNTAKSPITVTILGDIDGNGQVGSYDFYVFSGKYGSSEGDEVYDIVCDLDGDGDVDSFDFYLFSGKYGQSI